MAQNTGRISLLTNLALGEDPPGLAPNDVVVTGTCSNEGCGQRVEYVVSPAHARAALVGRPIVCPRCKSIGTIQLVVSGPSVDV
jgi:hypothetical protein